MIYSKIDDCIIPSFPWNSWRRFRLLIQHYCTFMEPQ